MLHLGWFIQRGRLLYREAGNWLPGRWCSTQGLGARAAQLSSQPSASCSVGVVGVLDQRRQGRVLRKARKVAARQVTNLCRDSLLVLRVLVLPGNREEPRLPTWRRGRGGACSCQSTSNSGDPGCCEAASRRLM